MLTQIQACRTIMKSDTQLFDDFYFNNDLAFLFLSTCTIFCD